jgi:hypothetical protein
LDAVERRDVAGTIAAELHGRFGGGNERLHILDALLGRKDLWVSMY